MTSDRDAIFSRAGLGGLGARILGYLPVTIAVLICIHYLMNAFLNIELGDEGVICVAAQRVSNGEVPYRDFFEIIPPCTFYCLAIFYKILGATFETGRIFNLLNGVGLVICYYFIAKKLRMKPLFAAAGLVILSHSGLAFWPYPSHHWLSNLFVASSLLALFSALEKLSLRWAIAGGALAGLAIMTLQDEGLYWILLAPALTIPFIPRGSRVRLAAGWGIGIAAVAALFSAMLLRHVSIGTLWYDWVEFLATRYAGSSKNAFHLSNIYGIIIEFWQSGRWRVSPLYAVIVTLCDFWVLAIPLLSIALLAALMPMKREERWKVGIMLAATLTMIGTALHRPSLLNIYWIIAIPSIAAAWGLQEIPGRLPERFRKLPTIVAALLVAHFVTFGFWYNYRVVKAQKFEIATPAGMLMSRDPYEAKTVGGFVKACAQMIPEREPIFCSGYIGMMYFLTQHPNPTRFNIFLRPEYHTDEQAREVIETLEKKKVNWIIAVLHWPNGEAFDTYRRTNFTPVWRNQDFEITLRNEVYEALQAPAPGAEEDKAAGEKIPGND